MLPQLEMERLSASRKALFGFFVSGLLLSFTGAAIPIWGHHLRSDYRQVANYFVGVDLGLVLSLRLAPAMVLRYGPRITLLCGCLIGFLVLASLSLTVPSGSEWRRIGALGLLGFAAALVNVAVFHVITPLYRQEPAAAMNLAGLLFGSGCVSLALLMAFGYPVYRVESLLLLLCAPPALFAISYARSKFPEPILRGRTPRLADFGGAAVAAKFSFLLFLQSGNEWLLAGWLPLFLIQSLGVSPRVALVLLAVFWLALSTGRIAAQWMLPRLNKGLMLLYSLTAALFGCITLTVTNNLFGASLGTLLVGFGFAAVFPLALEQVGPDFPSFHPSLYNRVFSLALIGGFTVPAIAGYLADIWGIRAIMLIPAIGTLAVFLLLGGIMIESKLSRRRS